MFCIFLNSFYPFSIDYTILLNLLKCIQSAPADQLVLFSPAFLHYFLISVSLFLFCFLFACLFVCLFVLGGGGKGDIGNDE